MTSGARASGWDDRPEPTSQSYAVLERFDGRFGSYEVIVRPAPRADRLLMGLLATGAVRLEGVRRVGRAAGVGPQELVDAIKRVGVETVSIDGFEHLQLPPLLLEELGDRTLA